MSIAPPQQTNVPRDRAAAGAPIRVMHVISGLGLGGAEAMLVNLAINGVALGMEANVVGLLAGGENYDRLQDAGVPVTDLAMRPGRPSVAAIRRLARLIRRHRPQVLQSWMYHADLMAWAARALVPGPMRPKLVWGVRCSDMRIDLYSRQLRWVIAACARLSRVPDLIIANSHAGRSVHVALGYHPDQFRVLANGVDIARFKPDPARRAEIRAAMNIPDDAPVAIMVARVDQMKDHANFLAAMALRPEMTALLIGRGTQSLDLPANVRALGARRDVEQLLTACDVIALSSAFGEGFPNALAEGMAAGLVPAATDVGDCGLIIGQTGLVAPPADPHALAAALAGAAFLAFKGGGDDARRRIADHYALPAAISAFRDTYAGLVDGSCAG